MLCLSELGFGYLCGKKVAEENIFMTLIFLVSNIFIAAIVFFADFVTILYFYGHVT